MKFVSLPRLKLKRLKFPSFFLLTSLILSLAVLCQTGLAQQQAQLSLVDIITALRSKKATVAERNQLLTEGVKQRGITFTLNSDLEKELRNAGASDELVEAIRQKSPVIKVSATPQPKVEPSPVSTPRQPDATFYQNRANANFVLGEYDLAVADYSKAIELNSKDSTIYFSRALAHFNKKSYNLAIADYDKVIELAPDESTAYYNRATALEKVGNFEKAMSDYQKAFELDATNELAKNSAARLQAALPKPSPTTQTKEANKEPNKETNKETNKEPNKEAKKESTTVAANIDPTQPVNVGSLNPLVVKLVMPAYPPMERQRYVQGLVTVQVTIDEQGKVISAKATAGPPTLRPSSEYAARNSKFKPYMVGDKAVKATGFITYNFKAN
jgi:TonB family protein